MSFIKEFKEFAMRGNVVDMAVGIIIGAAFSKIVTAMVDGLLMPPIGMLIGGVDFSKLSLVLKAATETSAAVTLKYGMFIQSVVDFTIIAFAIFMAIKALNTLKRSEEQKTQDKPVIPEDVVLLKEIRDLLAKK